MIDSLNRNCDELRVHINRSKQETTAMLEEASTLVSAKRENETKSHVLDVFKKHFIISDADLSSLISSAEPVTDDFFTVLAKVKQIHKDCEVLLGGDNQQLGVEMMEQTSRSLDAGYKKLYMWMQREFKTLDLEDPHISGSLRRALRVLAERPSLFQNCLDSFAESRQRTLSEAFQAALTEVTTDASIPGTSKPIEFSTYDLLRYLGDMLAWVHSATVSEKESLEGLFISDGNEIAEGIKAANDTEPWLRLRNLADDDNEDEQEVPFDGRKALHDLVDRDVAGVRASMCQRVEIAIRNEDDAVLIYKARNLFNFYHDIFSRLIGADAALTIALHNLQLSTLAHFEEILADEAENVSEEPVSPQLSVPTFLDAAVARIAVLSRTITDNSDTIETDRILTSALEPFKARCEEMALSIPDPLHRAIFRLNCGLVMWSSLGSEIETPDLCKNLNRQIHDLESEVQAYQHHFLCAESGLSTLIDSTLLDDDLTMAMAVAPATARPPISAALVEAAAAKLDAFLSTAAIDALDNIKTLNDRQHAQLITEAALHEFCDDFEKIEAAIEARDEAVEATTTVGESHEGAGDGGTPAPVYLRPLFPRTSAEVRVLLS
jgi:conserved oligomeric Golgi complex subunit 6